MSIFVAKIVVEKRRLGDFVMDLAMKIPYVKLHGISVAVPDPTHEIEHQPNALAITDQTPKSYKPSSKLSDPQERVMSALKNGCTTNEDISQESGVRRVMRVIGTLKKKKLVKGHDGNYKITE